ncbi:MAG: sugar phosphate isomerase/epimerase [Candidatus Micrarchaeota archaeon]|nr:sugar phosphate isomerase/epimerase [Candidatus Micrarchaeota archaeon]
MIIGAMNNPKKEVAEQIHLFGESGFDFLELTIEAPNASPQKLAAAKKEINDALSAYNFGVVAHCPWYFSVAHPYASIQKATVEEFRRAFESAALFGAKKITIHTEWAPYIAPERQVLVAKTIETIATLHKIAHDLGIALLVENVSEASFSLDDFRNMFSELEVGMTLDVGHLLIEGEGKIEEYIRQFKKNIQHIHLHDNDKRRDLHLPIGAGKLDVPKTVAAIKAFYDGTITLEVHSEDIDYLKISRDKLEICWYGKRKHLQDKKYRSL